VKVSERPERTPPPGARDASPAARAGGASRRSAPGDPERGVVAFDEIFLRKLERLIVVSKSVMRGQTRGERTVRRTGTGLEFADHRDYVPGDDLRRLDWNLYGRLERPLVRLYDEDEDLPFYLLVDTSASMATGTPPKLRLALEAAAALAYVGLAALDRVALHPLTDALGEGLGPLRGKSQAHAVLAHLAALRPGGRTDLGAAVARFLGRHRRRGVVVLLSDFFDPRGYEEAVDRLRYGRFEPVLVQITAPEEEAPRLRSDVVLVDAETGLERELTVTPAVRAAYERNLRAHKEGLDRFCRRRAIPCFQVLSSLPFETLVLRIFRSRGVLA
jgi:uncharacterized protein (DUF58 family)